MIEKNFQIPKKEGQVFEPIPENVYQVELLDIKAEEKPKYKKPDETEIMLSFQFVLLNGTDLKSLAPLRGRNIWRNFVPAYLYIGGKGKNVLYQIIEALIGRELTPEDEATMDSGRINKLVTRQCRVVVKNQTKDGKTYSNIETFLPIEAPLQSLTAEEKDNARIKKEDGQTVHQEQEPEINVDDIPFG